MVQQPIGIFFSSAHADDELRDQLARQLKILEHQQMAVTWCDRQIPAGSQWANVIDDRLNAADIILLLISPDFLSSDFCMKVEYPRAMERHEAGEACVIPVLLRSCPWKESTYNTLQAYPKDLVPVTSWRNQDEALYNVVQGILAAVNLLLPANKSLSSLPKLSQPEGLSDEEIEERYLDSQRYAVEDMRSEGIPQQEGIFTTLLEEVFVPLALSTSAMFPGFTPSDLERCMSNGLSIWDFLARADTVRNCRQLVILAWGGYGKTTLLKHIAYIYSSRQQSRYDVPPRIPVFLPLRKHRELLIQTKPPSLSELIATHHAANLPDGDALPTAWVQAKLKVGEMLVMFDGFDEVAKLQRPAVAGWINQQMQQYPKSVFIVTSRPKAYKEQTGERLELDTLLWVQEFNADQRKDLVKRWYLCQERYNHGGRDTPSVRQLALQAATDLLTQIEDREELQLRDLAKNPLLLNMMLRFHRQYPGADLPKRRVNLYEEICRLQLKDRPNARKLETLLTQCEAQVILQMLALEMMKQRQERLERNDLLQLLARYLQAQAETVEATEFLEQVEQISELLVRREEEYEFAHLSFQEYLAATQIAQQNQEQLLYKYFADDWWRQTILLYAAQTKKPSTLIGEMMSLGAADLAYAYLQTTSKHLDSKLRADVEQELAALKQTVQESRYRQLEALLKAQQWKEADEETDRLMIATVGKEKGQNFTSDELLNFPCEELRSIDGLWVKYSKGRFGFSVQKDIYVACGGKLDGKYPGDEIWEEFGDRVGWRESNEWLSSLQLDPSVLYPQGNFPFSLFWCGWAGLRVFGSTFLGSLLSHKGL